MLFFRLVFLQSLTRKDMFGVIFFKRKQECLGGFDRGFARKPKENLCFDRGFARKPKENRCFDRGFARKPKENLCFSIEDLKKTMFCFMLL